MYTARLSLNNLLQSGKNHLNNECVVIREILLIAFSTRSVFLHITPVTFQKFY